MARLCALLIVALVYPGSLTGPPHQARAQRSLVQAYALDGIVVDASTRQTIISSSLPDHQLPNLFHASIADLSAGLWKGNFTSVELTRAYLARIRSTHKLNAILTISPYALVEASDADIRLAHLRAECGKNIAQNCSTLPLLGIPYLAKDNIAVPPHVGPTTAGSFALLNTTVRHASTVVQQLARAGAVLIGMTNMDEFAQAKGKAPWGFSSRGGQIDSPYYSGGNVCGSSGGSAVAVSLGLSAFALGTQTGWSIVCPSSKLGVVGLKPGLRVLDMKGIIPISYHLDAVGPITRTVADAALVFHVLREDNRGFSPSEGPSCPRSWKIGVPVEGFWSPLNLTETLYHDVSRSRNELLEALKANGVEVQYTELPNLHSLRYEGHNAFSIIGTHDLATGISSYLSGLEQDGGLHTLSDIISWHQSHSSIALPSGPKAPNGHPLQNPAWLYSDQSGLEYSASLAVVGDHNASYQSALKDMVRIAWDENLEPYLNGNDLDFMLVPSESFAAEVAAMAGLPMLTIPLGFMHSGELDEDAGWPYDAFPGMPFGVSVIGRKGQEDPLLVFGAKIEHITQEREGQEKRWERIRSDVKQWLRDAESLLI